jgi:2-oxoglutarate ferredoxin oxidoreductase subunit alpha
VPKAVIDANPKNDIAIVTLGSGDGPAREALARLRAQGVQVNYMRVRGFPFGEEVENFLSAHQMCFVVEQNRDAQLRALLTLETGVEKGRMRSILHYNGMPLTAGTIIDGIMAVMESRQSAPQLVGGKT